MDGFIISASVSMDWLKMFRFKSNSAESSKCISGAGAWLTASGRGAAGGEGTKLNAPGIAGENDEGVAASFFAMPFLIRLANATNNTPPKRTAPTAGMAINISNWSGVALLRKSAIYLNLIVRVCLTPLLDTACTEKSNFYLT
ncbi:MAG: hypothetical protein HC875_15505 [Anaerolineales bacterium]|nr:hypothetical protein [Anaerolineales bacterium]